MAQLDMFLRSAAGLDLVRAVPGVVSVVSQVDEGLLAEALAAGRDQDGAAIREAAHRLVTVELREDVDEEAMIGVLAAYGRAMPQAGAEPAGPMLCSSCGSTYDEAVQTQLGDAAAFGMGARSAWAAYDGAKGETVAVADIELGWRDQPGLPALTRVHGMSVPETERNHGTMTVGVLGALGTYLGLSGVAPGLARVVVSSYNPPHRPQASASVPSGTGAAVAAAIFRASTWLTSGDVLLLEIQTSASPGATTASGNVSIAGLPISVIPVVEQALRVVSARGIHVVEAAGNAGVDLATLSFGGHVPWTSQRTFFGSIIVSGAQAATNGGAIPMTWLQNCNYGQPVDCCAQSMGVVTLGALGQVVAFSGSSSASAIMAGVAASVVGAAAKQGRHLGVQQLRQLVKDPSLGTPVYEPKGMGTGAVTSTVCDLMAVIPALAKLPDVRIGVGGLGPRAGWSNSPDIRVLPRGVKPVTFVPPGDDVHDVGLAESAGPHDVWVRVSNPSPTSLVDVKVKVFLERGASCPLLSNDADVGHHQTVSLAAGAVAVVGPFPLPSCTVGARHQLVATVSHTDDPVVPSAVNRVYERFVDKISRSNNVASRGIVVGAFATKRIPFHLGNPFDAAVEMSVAWQGTTTASATVELLPIVNGESIDIPPRCSVRGSLELEGQPASTSVVMKFSVDGRVIAGLVWPPRPDTP